MSELTDTLRNAEIQNWLWTEMVHERNQQDEKWGEQNHTDEYWLGIVMEEIGEVAKATIERKDEELTEEIVHSMAVLCSWMEARNRRWFRDNTQDVDAEMES